jgi:hypothetical protein
VLHVIRMIVRGAAIPFLSMYSWPHCTYYVSSVSHARCRDVTHLSSALKITLRTRCAVSFIHRLKEEDVSLFERTITNFYDSFRCEVQAYGLSVMLVCDNPTEISDVWSVFRKCVHRFCATKLCTVPPNICSLII